MTKLGAASSATEITTILSNEGLQLQFVTGSATNIVFPQEVIGIYGQDEAVGLGTGTILNVVGTDVTLSLSGNVLQLLHTNPTITFPQEVIGIYGQDEAVGLGTGTTLNVVGSDISLSISGTVLTLLHSDPTGTPHSFLDLTDTPDTYSGQGSKYVAVNSGATALEFVIAPAGGGGGGSGLVVYDDSVYKVTGTVISFNSNLSVTVTGSVAFVSASSSGGADFLVVQVFS